MEKSPTRFERGGVFGISSSFETNCDRIIPTMAGERKAELVDQIGRAHV